MWINLLMESYNWNQKNTKGEHNTALKIYIEDASILFLFVEWLISIMLFTICFVLQN